MSERILQWSAFPSLADTTPIAVQGTWADFKAFIGTHTFSAEKQGGPGFSCAVFRQGSTRANKNAVGVDLLAFDLDDINAEQSSALAQRLNGYSWLIYTTYSDAEAQQRGCRRLRLVLPLVRTLEPPEFASAWKTARRYLACEAIDEACKDISRFYWLPLAPRGAEATVWIGSNDGTFFDPDPDRLGLTPSMTRPARPDVLFERAEGSLEAAGQKLAAAKEGSRDDALNKLAFKLGPRVALGEYSVEAVENRFVVACAINGLLDDLGEDGVREKVRRALAAGAEKRGVAAGRPVIEVDRVDLAPSIDAAALAFGAADPPILYQRAGRLVRVVSSAGESFPRICDATKANIKESVSSVVNCVRYSEKGMTPVVPPDWLVDGLRDRAEWADVPLLRGVSAVPFVRPSGEIALTPGYDQESRVYLGQHGLQIVVPDCPTRDHAWSAYCALLDPTRDFSFASEAHRVAYASLLLTLFARNAFDGPSPMFLLEASTRGSGKTLLADVAHAIAFGSTAPKQTYSSQEEEMRKLITSLLLLDRPMVLLDNVVGSIGSPALDAVLTSRTWSDRLLGKNETVEVPARTVWVASGNNLGIGADTHRRVVLSRLVPPVERPEEGGVFTYPRLLEHVLQHRARLVSAALTILVAHAQAGRPRCAPDIGSYEGWCAVVRDALIWCGAGDPCATREDLAQRDDQLEEVAEIHEMLAALDKEGAGLLASEIVSRASGPTRYLPGGGRHYELLERVTGGHPTNPQRVGQALRRHRDRVVRGRRLVQAPARANSTLWRIEVLGGDR